MNGVGKTGHPTGLPARLNPEETARFLGCAAHDVPVLVKAGLLQPLGDPPANAVKYFATSRLMGLWNDENWLAQVSDALVRHWQSKNRRRSMETILQHEGSPS
ncbi:MAG: hypothetical protein JNK85_14775 [Verrucomicrobiales bacterium]|nr:hypothetical protein [Verrucomicrobiales bacterium]